VRIALDATYTVDPHPSGIAVYSNELLSGLAETYPDDEFLHCYRVKQFISSEREAIPNVKRRLLLPPFPSFVADVFHSLNQRVDRRPAKKVVSTFHDLFVMTEDYSSPEFRARFTNQALRAGKNSDLIICVSEFTASQVVDLLQVERSRIRVVPHGVHEPAVEKTAKRENIILFVGALQIRKNLERLVEAFEQLSPNWSLVLAGAPVGYRANEILERIERSPARERIRITGYLPKAEIESLYSRASIFAFPSLDEGFGMPVLEAMAHGTPVITSNRPALSEVAGNAALLLNPQDREELATGLARLVEDTELRSKLSELGRIRARLFSWENAVRATYSVYRELLG